MAVIGISGSYGGLNLGDEAILTSMIDALRAEVPGAEIVVFSRNAKHTAAHHAVERVVAVREATRNEVAREISGLRDRRGSARERGGAARRRRDAEPRGRDHGSGRCTPSGSSRRSGSSATSS